MINIVINEKFKSELGDFIVNLPNSFDSSGDVFFSARNIIKTFEVKGVKINVKSFQKPHFINQFVYATFRKSKARRSYEYALKLKNKEVNTPTPIAYIEQKQLWLLKQSSYISMHEEFCGSLQKLREGTLDMHKEMIIQFAKFTASIHEKNILHLDYSSGNILFKQNENRYDFYLVDLNRMTFDKPIDLDKACFNFRRLWGSDVMLTLFVQEYAKARNFDVDLCLNKTFYYRERFWRFFSKKHPHERPYFE